MSTVNIVMSCWARATWTDAFNLNNIAHIWVQDCPNGFYLMGEMMHNGEEVVLSCSFPTKEECMKLLDELPNQKVNHYPTGEEILTHLKKICESDQG